MVWLPLGCNNPAVRPPQNAVAPILNALIIGFDPIVEGDRATAVHLPAFGHNMHDGWLVPPWNLRRKTDPDRRNLAMNVGCKVLAMNYPAKSIP